MAKLVNSVRHVEQNMSLTGWLALLGMEELKNSQKGGYFPIVGEPGSGNPGSERWAGVRPRPRPRRARSSRAAPAPPPKSRPARLSAAAARARPAGASQSGGTRGRGLLQPLLPASEWGWGNWVFLRAASAPGSVCRVPSWLLSPRKAWTVLFWKEQACCQVVLNGVPSQSHSPLHMAWM